MIEKWYIKRDATNADIINKWANEGKGEGYFKKDGYIMYPSPYSEGRTSVYSCNFMDKNKKDYQEIDIEYFEEHILHQKPEAKQETVNNTYQIY